MGVTQIVFFIDSKYGINSRSIDIRAMYLQPKTLDREFFMAPPQDIKTEGKYGSL